ncbi:hypothetical protein AB3S75_034146 [Citrus x aurantiifolia]
MGGWTTRMVFLFFEATVYLWIVLAILSFSRVCVRGLGMLLCFYLYEWRDSSKELGFEQSKRAKQKRSRKQPDHSLRRSAKLRKARSFSK